MKLFLHLPHSLGCGIAVTMSASILISKLKLNDVALFVALMNSLWSYEFIIWIKLNACVVFDVLTCCH